LADEAFVPRGALGHLVAAVGAFSALSALIAIFDQSWELVYAWLGVGLLCEGADNLLWSTADTDSSEGAISRPILVVTFLNSVFVPVIAMYHAGFLDGWFGIFVAVVIIWAAQFRLAYHPWTGPTATFVGFPAAWSIVGFNLHAFDATPMAAVLIIGVTIIIGLVPLHWPHPLHANRWPHLTRALVAVWFGTAAATLLHGFPATPTSKAIFLAAVAYTVALAALTFRQNRRGAETTR
jgi:phosphatidylcholine synthase